MRRLVAILPLLAAQWTFGDDAPSFRAGSARLGGVSELVPPKADPIAVKRWTTAVSAAELVCSPAIAAGRVYIGTQEGTVFCLNPDDGSVLWSFATGSQVRATPAYHKGRLYVASTDGYLYYLHALTGQLLVDPIYHGTAMESSPVVAGGVSISGTPTDLLLVALGSPAYVLRAYDAKTGALHWTGQPGLRQISWSAPSYHAEFNRVVIGDNSGYWTCYDASTGAWYWTFRGGSNSFRNAASCVGDYVILPGGGGNDRNLYVLKQLAVPPYFSIHQTILAIPPNSTSEGLVSKVGGTPEGQPDVRNPQLKVQNEELDSLRQLPKADRDKYLDDLAALNNADYDDLKDWLDLHCGDVSPNLNKPDEDPVSYVNLSRSATFSSGATVANHPAAGSHRAVYSLRELSGVGTDSFYTLAIDVTPDPANTKVVWGTQLRPFTLSDLDHVSSPFVSSNSWLWNARGTVLEARNFSDGVKSGSVDVEAQILGGPVLADGRIFLTTDRGDLLCYDSGNNPPLAPTIFTPSGGVNLTTTNSPTLSWSGQFDLETAGNDLVSELQFGIGYENRDLELSETAPVEIVGATSYPLGPMASNTHVYWRVRVRDENGARSRWSDIQNFWIQRDTAPPEPPAGIAATPLEGAVQVDWSPSASPDILKYRIYFKVSGASWSGAAMIDDLAGSTKVVTGLVNGTTYDFMVVAIDQGENESSGVTASATPQASISIGGTNYGTVQAAIDAAAPGQTVVLGVGTFVGNLVLKPGVSLRGYSAKHTRIVGTGIGPVITVQGVYLTDPVSEISHLLVTTGQTGIDGGTADLYVHHVAIYAINGHAIAGSLGGRLRVVNATLMSNVGHAVDATTDAALTTVKNSVIGKNSGGVFVAAGSQVTYNTMYQNDPDGDLGPGVTATATGSLAVSFTNEGAGDFTETAGASSIDESDPADPFSGEPSPNGSRRNQGAFGDTSLAQKSETSVAGGGDGGGGGGGGGGCGAMGLEFLLLLGLLKLMRRGKSQIPTRDVAAG